MAPDDPAHVVDGQAFMIPEGGYGALNSVQVSDRYAVTAVAFDTREEILWTGK